MSNLNGHLRSKAATLGILDWDKLFMYFFLPLFPNTIGIEKVVNSFLLYLLSSGLRQAYLWPTI